VPGSDARRHHGSHDRNRPCPTADSKTHTSGRMPVALCTILTRFGWPRSRSSHRLPSQSDGRGRHVHASVFLPNTIAWLLAACWSAISGRRARECRSWNSRLSQFPRRPGVPSCHSCSALGVLRRVAKAARANCPTLVPRPRVSQLRTAQLGNESIVNLARSASEVKRPQDCGQSSPAPRRSSASDRPSRECTSSSPAAPQT
jgi:hypothetical protein